MAKGARLTATHSVTCLQAAPPTCMVVITPRQRAIPAPEARKTFVEIRLAVQLISSPKKLAPLFETDERGEVLYGPATPPVKGVDSNHIPKGVSLKFVLDVAWNWRGSHVKPKVQIPVRVPSESHLLEMERVAPNVAAHYRQQIAETISGNKRMKLTRTIARVQQLIVDQYGWPERD